MNNRRLTPFASIPLLFLSILLTVQASAQSRGKPTLNVREFGATGDGKTKDTAALQRALDRCWALGGCEVLLPAGEYLTGALALRSNTTLRMERGATVLGTPDLADYPVTQVRWEGKWVEGHVGLIYAIDAEHIAVVGPGRGAFIEDINATDLDVSGMVGGFLRFNFLNSGLQDQTPCPDSKAFRRLRIFTSRTCAYATCPYSWTA